MRGTAGALLFAAAASGAANGTGPPPRGPPGVRRAQRFKDFLDQHMSPASGRMPLSYLVHPPDYFDHVPEDDRVPIPHRYNTSKPKARPYCKHVVGKEDCEASNPCEGLPVPPERMNAYTFQTEVMLVHHGLNVYDGSVWCIAKGLLGDTEAPRRYMRDTLLAHETHEFPQIRGDTPCIGLLETGECVDGDESGQCGFCYGDNRATRTQGPDNAYFFRMISDHWAVEGTSDERCPEEGHPWTWNDYKPILGENAWANYIGALGLEYLHAGRNVRAIDDDAPGLLLAVQMLPALKAMAVGADGQYGRYFCPRNTWFGDLHPGVEVGGTVSIENMASLLAGLKGLRYVLRSKGADSRHHHLLQDVDEMYAQVENMIVLSWNGEYFRQGATYHAGTGLLSWDEGQGGSPDFAVDCQTWTSTILGPDFIDERWGAGTSLRLWETVKRLSPYGAQPNGYVKGVGYTRLSSVPGGEEVYSAEWTLGAVNWLRTMARSSTRYTAAEKAALEAEADFMLDAVDAEMVTTSPVGHGRHRREAASVVYANRRYYIPFGWYANRLPSLCSTAWMATQLIGWNPLMINGAYTAEYPAVPSRRGAPGMPTPGFTTWLTTTQKTGDAVDWSYGETVVVSQQDSAMCTLDRARLLPAGAPERTWQLWDYAAGSTAQYVRATAHAASARCARGTAPVHTIPAEGAGWVGPPERAIAAMTHAGEERVNGVLCDRWSVRTDLGGGAVETLLWWTEVAPRHGIPVLYVNHTLRGGVLTEVTSAYDGMHRTTGVRGCQAPVDIADCASMHCAPRPDAHDGDVARALTWVCLPAAGDPPQGGGVDCAAIRVGGARHYPNTQEAHAAWAFDQYYHSQREQAHACQFDGAAAPRLCSDRCERCSPVASAGDEELRREVEWACGDAGIGDCAPIRPGGEHYEPNTPRDHARWAFGTYFDAYACTRGRAAACDFGGAAELVAAAC